MTVTHNGVSSDLRWMIQ